MTHLTQETFLDRRTFSLRSPHPEGQIIHLNRADYAVLDRLTRDPGEVVRYQTIIDLLWPDAHYRTLIAHPLEGAYVRIHHVRRLLASQGWHDILVNRFGIGWQIDTDVAARLIRDNGRQAV